MTEYSFWYSGTTVYKAGFEAKSLEEAEKMLKRVFVDGDLSIEELPNFWDNDKDSDYDYSPESLKAIEKKQLEGEN